MTAHYPSRPLTQVQPDRLATQLRLRGLTAAPVATARVLEIGCADAGNLAALAAYAPEATFVGVDIDEAAVADAQRHALPNLRVIVADLADLDLGEFDYVLAHGVLSWIPDPDALFDCVDRHLAPSGAAYLSYDCLPGAHLRMMVGEVLRREAGADVARARELMGFVERSEAPGETAQIMRFAMRRANAKPDHVLLHDELQDVHTPFFLSDVARSMADRGMYYAGEAHFADGAETVAAAQWSDYASGRPFRQSVFSRRSPGVLDPRAIRDLHVSAPARRDGAGFEMLRGVQVEATGALADDLVALGEVWPRSLPGSALTADPAAVIALYKARAIDVRSAPVVAVPVSERPCVVPYMRRRRDLTTCRHEPLRLDDAASIRAVSLMDGTATLPEIAERVAVPLDGLQDLADALGRAGLFVR